jgi:mono/diheme cytochrome c family protein
MLIAAADATAGQAIYKEQCVRCHGAAGEGTKKRAIPLEVAAYVADHVAELSGVPDDSADRTGKLRAFCSKFAERAFRRPLSEAERQLVDRQFEAASDPGFAVKRVVLLAGL